jgi:hypothetical protein
MGASVPDSLTCLKAGVSMILSRIKRPTPTSTMLRRNGTRQPHDPGSMVEEPK